MMTITLFLGKKHGLYKLKRNNEQKYLRMERTIFVHLENLISVYVYWASTNLNMPKVLRNNVG